MLAFANAKINLGLFLTEKRVDGYHNLQTVFYPVKLHDVVELIDSENTTCVIKGIEIPGNPDDNICVKAFRALQNEFGLPHQQIILLKNIPVGAGLGGGSADAAFLIKLVNDKFDLGLSIEKMQDYARVLGADCAFFIENKPAYAFAKGDEFEDLEIDLSNHFMVLVKPPIHVSTAEAYSKVKVKEPTTSLKDLIHLPLSDWKANILNDFEVSVFEKYPEIDEIKTKLYAAGATFALMSGSGSSVYAIFEKPVRLPELEKDNLVFYGI
ncbi:4-(cytidine 5'-diphospho)-2-C-methyl-D-erythritol kinase [Pedobacter frigiditerrae]|uniref:4-diphosphocytidyl-2-C-methyl-D-erythritol kinase n=1 Tax=Pedobacter frigiditerrae TaxID=2530452 RepID=A0A4R0MR11_9SPHI|nr:4-(cytidine 5'-diphospho)-2-C-methyl-D-erythritol kinase [Pedobacter frigiditerrae]TCC89351.1 4-(cytidine 5'-diphospho)-2-C-methyl-D-erythritol kinase [Pedobacter frigiditerrae]